MKTCIKHLSPLPALIAGLGLMLAGPVTGQTFTTLYSFTALNNSTNSDGAGPSAVLLSGNTLYGTAYDGGTNGNGTVFAINTNGTGFTTLYSFTALNNSTNGDGAKPRAGLIVSGNTLYGTAYLGGTNGNGTVFAVNTNGTGFTNLYNFTYGSDGAFPAARLLLSGNTLYGGAVWGGTNLRGTVFALNTNGTGFTTLHSFGPYGGTNSLGVTTNSDGYSPYDRLILSGNTLYGACFGGGTNGSGTVFALNTNGTGFTILHTFTAGSGSYPRITNSDGGYPVDGLVLSGNTLYGTAGGGGTNGNGTVFALNTDGTGFTNLHTFTATDYYGNNSDGANPSGGLLLSGNTLYGTAGGGGSSYDGTVFALNTDGTGFTNLHTFTATDYYGNNSDGAHPSGGLLLSGNTLYGTAGSGGTNGNGTVFSLTLSTIQSAPIIHIQEVDITSNINNGLVAYWPFNGNANDATGNGNDGTLAGGVSLTTNRFGASDQAYSFDGTGYIQIPNTPMLDIADSSPITVALWALKTGSGTMHILGKRDGCVPAIQYQMPCYDQSVVFSGTSGTGAGALTTLNNWTHLVGECDGFNLLFFTNGILSQVATNETLGDPASTGLEIGDSGTCSPFFVGQLDDVRIYNRALSASEVQMLYAYDSLPNGASTKAVVLSFSNLSLGSNYQLQVSADLNTWTIQGSPFTATNTSMVYPQYFIVSNGKQLFFRLQVAP